MRARLRPTTGGVDLDEVGSHRNLTTDGLPARVRAVTSTGTAISANPDGVPGHVETRPYEVASFDAVSERKN